MSMHTRLHTSNHASRYVHTFMVPALLTIATPTLGGELQFLEVITNGVNNVDGMQLPFSVATSPDGMNIYVAGAEEIESGNGSAAALRGAGVGLGTLFSILGLTVGSATRRRR